MMMNAKDVAPCLEAYLELAERARQSTMIDAASTIQDLRDKLSRIQTAAEALYDRLGKEGELDVEHEMAPLFRELGTWPYDPIEEDEIEAGSDTPKPTPSTLQ